jgi:hypothetical protein
MARPTPDQISEMIGFQRGGEDDQIPSAETQRDDKTQVPNSIMTYRIPSSNPRCSIEGGISVDFDKFLPDTTFFAL